MLGLFLAMEERASVARSRLYKGLRRGSGRGRETGGGAFVVDR